MSLTHRDLAKILTSEWKPDAVSASSEPGTAEAPSSPARRRGTCREGEGPLGQLGAGDAAGQQKGKEFCDTGITEGSPSHCKIPKDTNLMHNRVFATFTAHGINIKALKCVRIENKMQNSTFF